MPEIQFRDFRFDRKAINAEARTVRISLSSAEPVERAFGREVLSHAPGAIRLERFRNGAPLLFNHDRDAHIGRLTNPRVENGKLVADALFSKSAFAEEKFQDALAGILVDSSLGYVIHRLEAGDEKGVLVAIDWEPLEGSLVTIPADVTTGIGRSHYNKPIEDFMPQEHTQTDNRPPTNTRAQEQDRCRTLATLGLQYEGVSAEMQRLIEEGGTVEQAYKFVADSGARRVSQGRSTNPGGGNRPLPPPTRRDGYGNEASTDHRSIGLQIAEHPDMRALVEGGKKSISFPLNVASFRAALLSSNVGQTITHGGVPVVGSEQRLELADLLARGVLGTSSLRYPRENSVSAAGTTPEGVLKNEITFDLEPIDASLRKISAFCRASSEVLDDVPAFRSYLETRLGAAVSIAEASQVLNGDGVGANMLGLLNQPGLLVQPKAADSIADCIRKAIARVETETDFYCSGIALHPQDFARLQLLKDANGQFLLGNIFLQGEIGQMVKAPSLWNLPIAVTKAAPEGSALVGAYSSAAQLFRRSGLVVSASNSDGDNFVKNLVTVLVEQRAVIAVYNPSAFCVCTGLNA